LQYRCNEAITVLQHMHCCALLHTFVLLLLLLLLLLLTVSLQ
jgi:hypothetical protein